MNDENNMVYVIAYDENNAVTGYKAMNTYPTSHVTAFELLLDSETFGSAFNAIRFSAEIIDDNSIVTINEVIEQKDIDIPTSLAALESDAYHRTVTDEEKAVWTAKSDFSGNYDDLTNKPTIPTVPTKVSEFENDAGYITQHQDISGKVDNTETLTMVGVDTDGNAHTWTIYGKVVG
jgi:hypothetical protein